MTAGQGGLAVDVPPEGESAKRKDDRPWPYGLERQRLVDSFIRIKYLF
jgi:hypothetical protein